MRKWADIQQLFAVTKGLLRMENMTPRILKITNFIVLSTTELLKLAMLLRTSASGNIRCYYLALQRMVLYHQKYLEIIKHNEYNKMIEEIVHKNDEIADKNQEIADQQEEIKEKESTNNGLLSEFREHRAEMRGQLQEMRDSLDNHNLNARTYEPKQPDV